MRRVAICLMLAGWAALSGGCAMFPRWRPESVEIPKGRYVMPLIVHRSQPYVMGHDKEGDFFVSIDTGCPYTVLSPALGKLLNAQEHAIFPMRPSDGGGHTQWQSTAARIDELSLSAVRFHTFDATMIDLINAPEREQIPIKVIAGLALFEDCLLTIDFPGESLVVERGALPEENGAEILRYRIRNMNIEIETTIGGQKKWAKVDTGFLGQLLVSEDLAATLSLKGPPAAGAEFVGLYGSVQTRSATLAGDLEFGNVHIRNPTLVIGADPGDVWVGSELLQRFRITIDQKNRRIRFAKP